MAATSSIAGRTVKLPVVNKQIIEIKKRIQLSEGQRKALFEEIESERKKTQEEIQRLKREISKKSVILNQLNASALKTRMPVARLQSVLGGHVGDKTGEQIVQILDLHIIDKNKQLDLFNYKIKLKERELRKLAGAYQNLITKKASKLSAKIEKPLEKAIGELNNKINAIEVQWREAEHIKTRYKDIKRTLQDDAARFESKVKEAKQELKEQQNEIEKLQQVNEEAAKLRNSARNALLQEEKSVVQSGNVRENQAIEGKRLVTERRRDLEKLERGFYHGPKPQIGTEADEDSPKEEDTSIAKQDPIVSFIRIFETIKEATGGSDVEDILKRFQSQKSTQIRLTTMRCTSEKVKERLVKTQEKCNIHLESLKFEETKDAQQSAEEVERIAKTIEEQGILRDELKNKIDGIEQLYKVILEKFQVIYTSFNMDQDEIDASVIVEFLKHVLCEKIRLRKAKEFEHLLDELDPNEEKWLPPPYVGIIRRTPLPQQGSPTTPAPPPVGSDEEEEVPSRGYLKRQAQLVVDAKTKRKNLRFPISKK